MYEWQLSLPDLSIYWHEPKVGVVVRMVISIKAGVLVGVDVAATVFVSDDIGVAVDSGVSGRVLNSACKDIWASVGVPIKFDVGEDNGEAGMEPNGCNNAAATTPATRSMLIPSST